MKRLKTIIFALLLAVVAFLLSITAPVSAEEQDRTKAACSAAKLHILSEHTHNVIGYISPEIYVNGSEGDILCIGGEFGGQEYQYLYQCNRYGHWGFKQKLRTFKTGCMWGKIT